MDFNIEYLDEYINDIIKGNNDKIPTCFEILDNKLNGGLPRTLITLGAVPSLGKTTFILQMADNMAKCENTKVLFFSLEMTRKQLINKSYSRMSYENDNENAYTYDDIVNHNERVDYELLKSLYRQTAENVCVVDDVYELNEILDKIDAFVEENENANIICFLDYIQYIYNDNDFSDKKTIDDIVKKLKAKTKQHSIPIIAISTLSRSTYDKPVSMESFKESGMLEYGSDILLGLEYHNFNNPNNSKLRFRCLKNKTSCKEWDVKLKFIPQYNYFEVDEVLQN